LTWLRRAISRIRAAIAPQVIDLAHDPDANPPPFPAHSRAHALADHVPAKALFCLKER
jgi:hypothetical protein